MSEVLESATALAGTLEAPTYLERGTAVYKQQLISSLSDVSGLAAAASLLLSVDTPDLNAVCSVLAALDANWRNCGAAAAGLGATVSSAGSA